MENREMRKEDLETIDRLTTLYRDRLIKEFEGAVFTTTHVESQKARLKNLCKSVSDYFGLDYDKLMSNHCRRHEYTRARSIIFWFARNPETYMGFSLKTLGDLVGGFNHATVIHSINCFETDFQFLNHFRLDAENIFRSWGYDILNVHGKLKLVERNETIPS